MNENTELISNQIRALTAPFFDRGFSFSSKYEKGGDSSCVYICRYQKGRDYFDWREVSGGEEIHLVVYARGEYRFPNLERLYKKETRAFRLKHFFKRATFEEKRAFFASLLKKELQSGKPDFFGIAL